MIKAPVITIVQRRLTDYRVPFFLALRERLSNEGLSLRLLHGEGTPYEGTKKDTGYIEWAEKLPTTYFAGGRLCWQPFSKQAAASSLIILPQENAMLANHIALLNRPSEKIAFWGHGANLQGKSNSLREIYKRWTTSRVDWYFAYTKLSVDLIEASGFPRTRTTQLDNAIDISKLKEDLAAITSEEIAEFRGKFGLSRGPVGLYLGSLYGHKRLDMVLSAAERLRKNIDSFQLLIVGDGPCRGEVEAASARHEWIRFVGARKGREKAAALSLASIIMNPGLVGLGILDSFAARVPLITTDCGLHSPEIAYLTSENGAMTHNNVEDFAAACSRLITDPKEHARLSGGCAMSADHYTLSNMVQNFSQGIRQALDAPR